MGNLSKKSYRKLKKVTDLKTKELNENAHKNSKENMHTEVRV